MIRISSKATVMSFSLLVAVGVVLSACRTDDATSQIIPAEPTQEIAPSNKPISTIAEPQNTIIVSQPPDPTSSVAGAPPTTPPTALQPTATQVRKFPTALPTVTPTLVPTPTQIPPTATSEPTSTVVPTAASTTATPAPAATGTPDPFAPTKSAGTLSSRYGIIVHSKNPAVISWTLQQLGADVYIDFSADVSGVPAGTSKLIHIPVGLNYGVLSVTEIQDIAKTKPGAIWYVSGEPNVWVTADSVIEDLNYYYTEIIQADPTARITSPSILNWDFTCIGCGGYQSGESWMTEFVSRYQDLYGTSPPWDVWAIDLYPLDWWNLPNTGFTPEIIQRYAPEMPPNSESISIKQLQAYRDYIDSLPGKSGQPIIVTELGIHWGWSEIEFGLPGCTAGSPAGEYRPLVIRDYFDSVFTWLDEHAVSHNIERWFTYVSYSDITKCRADGYSAMSLLDSPGVNSQLTDFGRWYTARSAP